MSRAEEPNGPREPSFGWMLEIGLVAACSLLALAAYLVIYWPWRTDSSGSPLEVFAALPVLMATTFGAISMGSTKVVQFWCSELDRRPWLCWSYPAGIWLLYSLGTLIGGHAVWQNIVILGVYLAVPVVFALVRRLWGDWLMVISVALPILAGWVYLPNMPVPAAHNQVQVHPLFAACIGFWVILVVRRMEGFRFHLVFAQDEFSLGLRLFALFGVVMFPLAIVAGFGDLSRAFTLHQDWKAPCWTVYALLPIGMYFYPALVEEALYRGLLQNLLAKSLRSDWVALGLAAVVFGATHYKPSSKATTNEKVWFLEYAVFATIAGAVYGYAYLKTKRIMPGAVAHALINSLWLMLFNPDLLHLVHRR